MLTCEYDYENINNKLDYYVLLIGFVYDINFSWTIRYLKENKYFNTIIDKVIETEAEALTKSLKAEMLKNPILPEDTDTQDKAQSEEAKVDNKAEEGVSEGEALPLGEQNTETKAAGSTPQNETAQPVKGQ